ncbi:NCS1 allantoate transporter (NCS1 nucleoside transporter) [Colletotrichum tofieldiae]|uniref:NCS1 allantoate transporter (NCS1 nucleoside transporter) n=1 Tax=Colletotrichum tofieldiae TaxID=708197 RepID=A0A166LRA5_9PEZI|nr:NCS1 allantoate transporter (NCS1 nucleoside transporter) [Colletotrichum tofieldiae]
MEYWVGHSLTATDAILIVLLAGFCNAIPTVLNGAIGSSLHIAFPIASRASFGYWFSYFAVVSRGILAMFWFGVQTANGATCVTATSVTGGYSTLAVNISDFSRFSKESRAQYWQLPVIPFFKTIVALFGVISAAAAQQIWGVSYWTPLEIIATWQDNPGGRAAAFFCAAIWLLAQISVNISANAVSFANDITTLAPKWFDNRRGTVLVAFFGGWALCPWIIVASGKAFMNFMSAYSIFMAPMAGILFTDYWLIKRRRYDVPALYDPQGIYRYGKYGTNWRAAAATFIVIIPLLPGLVAKVSSSVTLSSGLNNLFSFNWLYGFFLSILIYYTLNYFFPHRESLIPCVVTGFETTLMGVDLDVDIQSAEGAKKEERAAVIVKNS